MRKAQKGFTLVELIVVITILAILGTIAFISLQGYSQDAKNSKVSSDIRTLASAIETNITSGKLSTLANAVTADAAYVVADTQTITIDGDNNTTSTGALSAIATYTTGTVNYIALAQNGEDFKDPEGNAYLIGVAADGSTAYYQLAGQTKEASGSYNSIIKGNYIARTPATDAVGLIADNTGTFGNGVLNDADLGTTGLY